MRINDDTNHDLSIDSYYSLKPGDFCDIEKLVIETHDDGFVTRLYLRLRPRCSTDTRHLVLTFDGVINLRFTPPERFKLQISQLEIRSILDMQWEGIRYSVREAEQEDTISFLCRKFTAEIVETIDEE